jgi:hypothetical protein
VKVKKVWGIKEGRLGGDRKEDEELGTPGVKIVASPLQSDIRPQCLKCAARSAGTHRGEAQWWTIGRAFVCDFCIAENGIVRWKCRYAFDKFFEVPVRRTGTL